MRSAVPFVKKKGGGVVTPDEAALLRVSVATTVQLSRETAGL